MANLTCPKCGGSDYFLSKRNIVKGMGWAQRGSLKSVPVCRVCDEIMDGAQVGMSSWEDLGRASKKSASVKFTKNDWIFFAVVISLQFFVIFLPYDSSIYTIMYILSTTLLYIFIFRVALLFVRELVRKRNMKRNEQ